MLGRINMSKTSFTEKNENVIKLIDAIPLPKPLAVSIEISGVCNFKCVYCPHSKEEFISSKRPQNMQLKTFNKVIADLRSWKGEKVKTLALNAFGESLLNPNFIDMITQDYTSLCDHSMLTTNASLLNGERARAILESDLTYLKISIYSIEQNLHEQVTQSRIDIEEIKDNIASFKSKRDTQGKGPFIYIKIFNIQSDKEKEKFFDIYTPLADEVGIETIMDWNSRENFAGNHVIQHKTRKVCPYPFYRMYVNNDGAVSFCCVDYMNDLAFDNVNANSLEEIWFSKDLMKIQNDFLLRKQSSYTSCEKCTFFNTDRVNVCIDSLSSEEFLNRYNDSLK